MHKVFSIVESYIRKKSYQYGGAHLEVGFLGFQFLLMTAEQIYDDRLSGEIETVVKCDVFFQKNIKPYWSVFRSYQNFKTSNPRKLVDQT
jgi:hypothetical protein